MFAAGAITCIVTFTCMLLLRRAPTTAAASSGEPAPTVPAATTDDDDDIKVATFDGTNRHIFTDDILIERFDGGVGIRQVAPY